jgi:hypothetical protein
MKHHKSARPRRWFLLAIPVVTVTVATGSIAFAAPSQIGRRPPNTRVLRPTQDLQPPSLEGQLDASLFDQGERSIVFRVNHDPDPQPIGEMAMSTRRAFVRHNDVGPIQVETFDINGKPIDTWQAVRPGAEGAEGGKDVTGRYTVPYTKDLYRVRVTDTSSGRSTEEKFAEVIYNFCSTHPTDVACDEVDLATDMQLPTPGPFTIAVGKSETVKLLVRFQNLKRGSTATSGYVGKLGNSGALNTITTFSTTDKVEWTWPVRDGTFDSGWLPLKYTLICTAPGNDRIFPEVVMNDSGLPHVVDANPANNHYNMYFDVKCV